MKIACIDYGAGNLRSITNGFKKVGQELTLTKSEKDLKDADAVVLPGVGAFGNAMQALENYRQPLKEKVEEGTPFLGVCLGIQLLMDESSESPGIEGLGILQGKCIRFGEEVKVPHMGWNTIEQTKDTPLLEDSDGDYFYFVHSYYVVPNSESVVAAKTQYGTEFPSAISEKNIHATQFHPEKSSDKGLKILENFTKMCRK